MREFIDELGALEAELAPTLAAIKPKAERVKWLKEQISLRAPAGQQVLDGAQYGAEVSQNALVRTITSLPRLFRTLGQGAFLANCNFGLGKFDEMVKAGTITSTDKAVLLHEEHTGARTVKTFLLPIKTGN